MSVRSSVREALTSTRGLAASIAAVALILFAGSAEAQQGAVAGQVLDATNLQPVSGAQVFLPNLDQGMLTNDEGRFRITGVPAGQHELRVRILGYRSATRTVTVRAGETTTANFELQVSAVRLGEVVANVITGEAQQRRELGTNSTVINADEVDKAANNTFQSLLQGRTSGVELQNVTGTTGAGTRIRIRGANSISLSNEPLVYVDGVRIAAGSSNFDGSFAGTGGQEPSRLNDLNPENIANIQVIKGPSATAQYGADAANGVILIETRRGSAGDAQWRFYGETGSLTDNTDWDPSVMSFTNISGATDPSWFLKVPSPGFTPDGVAEVFNSLDLAICTNLSAAQGACSQDVTFSFDAMGDPRTTPFSTGQRQRFGGNVSGGSENFSYFLSADWEEEVNVFTNNQLEKLTTRVNGNTQPRDDLNFNFNFQYVRSEVLLPQNDNNIGSPILNSVMAAPTLVPGDGGVFTEGEFRGTDGSFLQYGFNMTPDETQALKLANQQNDRVVLGTSGDYRPLDFLSVRWNLGVDINNLDEPNTLQPGRWNIAPSYTAGWRERSFGQRTTWTFNTSAAASYDLTDEISAQTTVGAAFDQERLERTSCFGSGLVPGLSSCAATSSLFEVDEDFSDIRTMAGFIQHQFTFRDNLFVTGSVRADDNSAAGGRTDIEFFPSANVSYVMSDEDYFPDTGSFLTEVRLRGAIGWAGRRPQFRDAATLFSPVSVLSGGSNVTGVTISSTGNPDLNVERVREIEAGVDLGLINERLSLQATYFDKTSTDALVEQPLPPSFGLTGFIFANLGEVKNSGFEVSLNGTAIDQRNVALDFQAQVTTNDSEITDLGGVPPITVSGNQSHRENRPIGSFFQQEIQSFSDANGDGLIGADEFSVSDTTVFVDEARPTWTTSLQTNLRLFQFVTVSSLVEARGGHSVVDATEEFRCRFAAAALNSGCPGNGDPNASLERQVAPVVRTVTGSENGFTESAKFLKLREVSVRFNAPRTLANALPIFDGTSLTLAGRNLATFTPYTGADPENVFTGATTNFFGEEFNTLGPARILTARLDFRF